ncbi:hypothetical protein B0H10DRAFT_2161971 [Mycena sp. CBHHK59/15]|nr:hypothetical protein B0H10DRAFT_2161971 [Mycena sp. CBHHK59/15]
MPSTDYATAFGFHSIPAAVVIALVYFPLFLWFIRQSIKNTTYVYISLTVFCLMRVAAFVLRAILSGSTTLGDNLDVFIADEILFGVGFFALLYSAYTLVLDRELITGRQPEDYLPLKIMRNRRLFRILLIVGVALGVSGISDASSANPSTASNGAQLRRVSTILFLVLTIIQALQTFIAFKESTGAGYRGDTRKFGDRNGKYILCQISAFLLVREAFLTATIGNSTRQNDERLWYPFVALPEVFAVACYAVSGLVPPRSELNKQLESAKLNTVVASYP